MLKMFSISKAVCCILTVIIIASFVGFCIENIWNFFRYGYIDNRGMCMPFLLGYGLACCAMYICFGLPSAPKIFSHLISNNNCSQLLYFLLIFSAIIIGESMLGYIVEFFTSIKWWDYSQIPLHIGRYTSIPTSFGFTFGAYLFLDKIFPLIYGVGERIFNNGTSDVILLLTAILILDNIHAFKYMYKHNKTLCLWKFSINSACNECTDSKTEY